MIICGRPKATRLGLVHCHQKDSHNIGRSGHIAYAPDPGGDLFIVSWRDNYPNAIQIEPVRKEAIMAAIYTCDACHTQLRGEVTAAGHDCPARTPRTEDVDAFLAAAELSNDPIPLEPCS